MKLKHILRCILSAGMLLSLSPHTIRAQIEKPSVYLAGDSTVKNYAESGIIAGWGQYLPYYLPGIDIINKSEGGRSARSFINEGRLDDILSEIKEGDYLFIQFGHNDAAKIRLMDTAGRYSYKLEGSVALGEPSEDGIYPVTPIEKVVFSRINLNEFKINMSYIKGLQAKRAYPYGETYYPYEVSKNGKVTRGTYKWYLSRYVEGALEKGAKPVIITPVAKRIFENGKIKSHHYDEENKKYENPFPNDGYVTAAIQLAEEYGIPYIDLYTATKQLYEEYGEEKSEDLQTYKSNGVIDNTHYSKYGAFIVSGLLAKGINEMETELSDYIREPGISPPELIDLIILSNKKDTVQSNKTWNFRTGAFRKKPARLVSDSIIVDGLHLVAGKNLKLDFDNNKRPDNMDKFTEDLTGALNINNSSYMNRVEIPVKDGCKISIYAEGPEDREIVIGRGPVATEVYKEALDGKGMAKLITYEYEDGPDTLCIYTNGGSGVYIYQIELEYH